MTTFVLICWGVIAATLTLWFAVIPAGMLAAALASFFRRRGWKRPGGPHPG